MHGTGNAVLRHHVIPRRNLSFSRKDVLLPSRNIDVQAKTSESLDALQEKSIVDY